MRLSALRKMIEDLAAAPPAGDPQLDYQSSSAPSFTYDEAGTGGWIQTHRAMMPAPVLVIVVVTVASNQGVALDVGGDGTDSGVTVDYTDINGTQILKAEVPPGQRYKVSRNGVASTVNDIREIPIV